jgi:ABC-2 type transport system ATP-binding protein
MAEQSPTAITVQGLVKRYGPRTVVNNVSFSVAEGEVFALLGPNGAGKTTTIEILEGYRSPDGGQARVLGLDPVRESGPLRRQMGLMLQQGGLYPQMTPREALRLFADFYDDPEDPELLLDRLGLREVQKTRFRRLSGGQKQRLALGLAIVGKPSLVFLDEPTAAMDPQARRDTWEVIRGLRRQRCTVMLTTHFMEEAEQLADRVAIMNHGQLVGLDTPRGLRARSQPRLRFATEPSVTAEAVAGALGIDRSRIVAEEAGLMSAQVEPTPELVARFTLALAEADVLLTELHAGSESLEQVYLDITGGEAA